jgi:capsid protein
MAFWDRFFGKPNLELDHSNGPGVPVVEVEQPTHDTKSLVAGGEYATSAISVTSYVFNGEKSAGELGNPIDLLPDYQSLRLRAYEFDLTADVVKIITGKFIEWVVATGLKMRSEPNEDVLNFEGIRENLKDFKNNVESYFALWASDKLSDYSGMIDFHDHAKDAFKTSFLGGDCLVVLRVDDNYNLRVQVIDGQHVCTPLLSSDFILEAEARGNKIKHGIEINKKREHVAYYVVTDGNDPFNSHERIEAKSKATGLTMAWMVYGTKHRIDHLRGVSQLTAILEKVKKIDRYTEASVSAAEERAKIPYTIEHSRFSDGENPLLSRTKVHTGAETAESSYAKGEALAGNVAKTTGKTVWNMPIDSKMKPLESNSEMNYEPFFKAVFVQLCASVNLPPEVALQQYNSNYSASRAATNGFAFILDIKRNELAKSFYHPIYKVWLHLHILKNKVSAAGYLPAFLNKNKYITSSYAVAKFVGKRIPHIDPKKEADALRKMIGDPTKGELPLITHEDATEQLGNGDYYENVKKFNQELEETPQSIKDASNSQNKK